PPETMAPAPTPPEASHPTPIEAAPPRPRPEPPPQAPPPPEPPRATAPPPTPPPAPGLAPSPRKAPRLAIGLAVGVALVLALAVFAWQAMYGDVTEETYVVQPYTPPSELISARERITGHEAPDASSPVAVVFGQGVTLNVTGRVSRGLGADWYAVAWNGRTVFVRQQDAVPGSGAPPAPVVR